MTTDTIVEETRARRASLAADFDYDLHRFFAWARAQSEAEREAGHQLAIDPGLEPTKADATRGVSLIPKP